MQNIEFLSGFLKGCRYHKQKHILDVTGSDGSVYQYFEVPETVIEEFIKSTNPRDYYRTYIRNKFRRLFKAYDYSVM